MSGFNGTVTTTIGQVKWLCKNFGDQDGFILTGDIGTTINLFVFGIKSSKFTIIFECVYDFSQVSNIIEPLKETLEIALGAGIEPKLCCISVAGPVVDNKCILVNPNWNIDGQEIKEAIHIKTLIIDDLLAIRYGINVLDVEDNNQITQLRHPNGLLPEMQKDAPKVLITAGPNLEVWYLFSKNSEYQVFPFQMGHFPFTCFDEDTEGLAKFINEKTGIYPSIGRILSNEGINDIYEYLKFKRTFSVDKELENAVGEERLRLIFRNTGTLCCKTIDIFIKIYGRFSGDIALTCLPFGGLYISGNVVFSSGVSFIVKFLFASNFERCKENENLQNIPIYMINSYPASLYGAANAAITLMNHNNIDHPIAYLIE